MKIDWEKLGLEPPSIPNVEIHTGLADAHNPNWVFITFFNNWLVALQDDLQSMCNEYGWRMTVDENGQGCAINCVGMDSAHVGNAIAQALLDEHGATVRLVQMIPNRHGINRLTVVKQLIPLVDG